MSIKLSEYKMSDMDFEKVCGHLIRFVKKTWNYKGMTPKDWDYRNDNDGREKDQIEREKQARSEFNGPNTSTACAPSVEERLGIQYVKYDADEQGRDPITSLISGAIAYGMIIEQERQNRINHFNARAALHHYEKHTAPAIAETYIEKDKREEFTKSIVDSYKFSTNTHYSNDFGLVQRHSMYTVQEWEGRFDEFLEHEEKELAEVSKLLDPIILEEIAKKIALTKKN